MSSNKDASIRVAALKSEPTETGQTNNTTKVSIASVLPKPIIVKHEAVDEPLYQPPDSEDMYQPPELEPMYQPPETEAMYEAPEIPKPKIKNFPMPIKIKVERKSPSPPTQMIPFKKIKLEKQSNSNLETESCNEKEGRRKRKRKRGGRHVQFSKAAINLHGLIHISKGEERKLYQKQLRDLKTKYKQEKKRIKEMKNLNVKTSKHKID